MLPNAQETAITTVLMQAQVGGKRDKGLLMHGYPRKRKERATGKALTTSKKQDFQR